MDYTLPADEWLDFIEQEYLSTFIPDGGSAIKFVVGSETTRSRLRNTLAMRCSGLGYVFVPIDSATCRAHMPQDIFGQIACRIDWHLLSRRIVLRLLESQSYSVEGINPDVEQDVVGSAAHASGMRKEETLTDMRPILVRGVLRNTALNKSFRTAMYHLCLSNWETDDAFDSMRPILEWLTGENNRITDVRPFDISTAINRTTARYFIQSVLHWVRFAGYAGTVLLLDNSRVTLATNPRDGKRYYTRLMTIDHYEMLRELVDDIERLPATFWVVSSDMEFTDDQSRRGWEIYPALRTRVMNDVRMRREVNPAATLVHLS